MKTPKFNLKKEWRKFSIIVWDQMFLSIIFTFIIYCFNQDYNFKFEENDKEMLKLWKCWHFSIVTQFTVGYGTVYPISVRGEIFNSLHIITSYYLLARDMTRVLD